MGVLHVGLLSLLAASANNFDFDGVKASATQVRPLGFFNGGDRFVPGVGSLTLGVTDHVTQDDLTYGDDARLSARFTVGADEYRVELLRAGFPPVQALPEEARESGAMPRPPGHPLGGGVMLDRDVFGTTRLGAGVLTRARAAIAVFGVGRVWKDGELLTDRARIQVTALPSGIFADDGSYALLREPAPRRAEVMVIADNLPRSAVPGGFIQFGFDAVEIVVGGTPVTGVADAGEAPPEGIAAGGGEGGAAPAATAAGGAGGAGVAGAGAGGTGGPAAAAQAGTAAGTGAGGTAAGGTAAAGQTGTAVGTGGVAGAAGGTAGAGAAQTQGTGVAGAAGPGATDLTGTAGNAGTPGAAQAGAGAAGVAGTAPGLAGAGTVGGFAPGPFIGATPLVGSSFGVGTAGSLAIIGGSQLAPQAAAVAPSRDLSEALTGRPPITQRTVAPDPALTTPANTPASGTLGLGSGLFPVPTLTTPALVGQQPSAPVAGTPGAPAAGTPGAPVAGTPGAPTLGTPGAPGGFGQETTAGAAVGGLPPAVASNVPGSPRGLSSIPVVPGREGNAPSAFSSIGIPATPQPLNAQPAVPLPFTPAPLNATFPTGLPPAQTTGVGGAAGAPTPTGAGTATTGGTTTVAPAPPPGITATGPGIGTGGGGTVR